MNTRGDRNIEKTKRSSLDHQLNKANAKALLDIIEKRVNEFKTIHDDDFTSMEKINLPIFTTCSVKSVH